LEEDIACGNIKAELASRLRVRRTDVDLLVSKPDGTTEVSLLIGGEVSESSQAEELEWRKRRERKRE